nr:hypothetical protein [Mesorhizobium loti]
MLETVDFSLLDTAALNARKMRGPAQYLDDAVSRARRFIERADHASAFAKALATAE